jgi:hypothetical protein
MSVYTCENCGATASTLARCPECGAVVGKLDKPVLSSAATRKIAPLLLGAFGLCLSVPVGIQAVHTHNARVAQVQIESERLLEVDKAKQQAEERLTIMTRADSILRTTPRSKIPKLKTEQLSSDVAIVGWRSDAVARRWIKSATSELKARSGRRNKRGLN